METSQLYKSSQPATASPDGAHLATIDNNRLHIRNIATLATLRSISLPQDHNGRYHSLRWSAISKKSGQTNRILLADDDVARVWDLQDEKWLATVRNGSGGMGRFVHAEFGARDDEALLFSDFGARMTVWSLSSGRSVEIKDPKFTTKGYAYRPHSGIFALLSRPGAQDVVTLHAPSTYFVIKTISLPSIDAYGLKWSQDGRWLVVWDTPSVGYRLYVYSADGHLYRTYNGGTNDLIEGLGIKSLEWSPRKDFIALGGFDRRVTMLTTRTFSLSVFLEHTPIIQLPGGEVWQEQVTAASRTYAITSQPLTPPTMGTSTSDPAAKTGVSITTFNADGSFLATKDESAPTTLWVWDLNALRPRAIFVQHAPIKSVLWHPYLPNLLLIQCAQDEQVLYLWDATNSAPAIMPTAFPKGQGRVDASWINTASGRRPAILLGDSQGSVLIWPEGQDAILRFESPSGTDESSDSLYEILTGKKPVQPPADRTMLLDDVDDDDSGVVEDTFMGKRIVDY